MWSLNSEWSEDEEVNEEMKIKKSLKKREVTVEKSDFITLENVSEDGLGG